MKPNVLLLPVLLSLAVPAVFSQQCRSYSRQTGYCVSITKCPPLYNLLQNRPTIQQLRQLQRLTCGFENSDPKVCCPTKVIFPPREEGQGSDSEKGEVNLIDAIREDDKRVGDFREHRNFKEIPPLNKCSEGLVTDRVIGGKEVEHGKYPWMARIGYQKGSATNLTYYCGGSVINKRYILTAAHCTEGLGAVDLTPKTILLGENNVKNETDCNLEYKVCSEAEEYPIEKIIAHRSYSMSTKLNDISLIRVARDISFDSYFIKPICLPFYKEYGIEDSASNANFPKPNAIAAGWGRTDPNAENGSDQLLEVSLPLKTNQECRSIYSKRVNISRQQVCAGGETGMDSCSGDSGGPLVGQRDTNTGLNRIKLFQLGIVSYGPQNCGAGGLPGVYTRVSQYLEWILDNIEPA